MQNLHENLTVQKRNILNELHSNNMTLQELRFFSIYLAKIDSRDSSSKKVIFQIDDFQKIMELGRLNIKQLKDNTDSLLRKIVHIPEEKGGYLAFSLFKRCRVYRDDYNQWFIEIEASDDALPMMFDFKDRFFQYHLWNVLSLKSSNQIRMYEILKQYEKIGKKEYDIEELKALLGIEQSEYTGRNGMNDFKKRVLDSCKNALKENTDICYTYAKGKSGKGGKWLSIVFHIEKNTEYKDKLSLSEFIDLQPQADIIETTIAEKTKADNTHKKIDLSQFAKTILRSDDEEQAQAYIRYCEGEMDLAIQKGAKINSKIDYLISIMKNNIDDFLKVTANKSKNQDEESEQSYDISEFDKFAINYRALQKAEKEQKNDK